MSRSERPDDATRSVGDAPSPGTSLIPAERYLHLRVGVVRSGADDSGVEAETPAANQGPQSNCTTSGKQPEQIVSQDAHSWLGFRGLYSAA